MMQNNRTDLNYFLQQQFKLTTVNSDGLERLLKSIASAIVKIKSAINEANVTNSNKFTNDTNCHGQIVNRLDIVANDILSTCLEKSGSCSGIASEELETFQSFHCNERSSQYICCFDPLDGSSNILVNGTLGTIFSIYRQRSLPGELSLSDFLQAGYHQVAAGYALYGPSTVFVYSTRKEVNAFTLDQQDDRFYLTCPNIRIQHKSTHYAFNASRHLSFPLGVRRYLKDRDIIFNESTETTYRYQGCMVADIHRIITQGGIFLNPPSKQHPRGKLRLVYECNPLAFVTEVAGGSATNGIERMLNITPESLHECSAIYIGSNEMVGELDRYHQSDNFSH